MSIFRRAGLYLVTSQSLSNGRSTADIVKAALAGGVRLIQLREKDLCLQEFVTLAEEVRRLTSAAGAILIINDRLDVALAVGADGLHLGQDDFPLHVARRLAPSMIIGASSHSLVEAREARDAGASYVNIGPVFPTETKQCPDGFLGLDPVREVIRVLDIPVTVMGGIKRRHIPELLEAGAETIALVTAVTSSPDPEAAARDLLSVINAD